MIKIQLYRDTKTGQPLPYGVDDHFIDGTVDNMPRLGEQLLFYYDKLGKGWLQSSPIIEILPGPDETIFRTKNSDYHIIEGWKDED